MLSGTCEHPPGMWLEGHGFKLSPRVYFLIHGNVSSCVGQDSQGKERKKYLVGPGCELVMGRGFEEVRSKPCTRKHKVQVCTALVTS